LLLLPALPLIGRANTQSIAANEDSQVEA